MVAPTCPINKGQPATNPRGTAPTLLPFIPIATDLPSLIRSVNIIRDILRNITTSLTVNNTYNPQLPRPPKIPGNKDYKFSPVPDWYQSGGEVTPGTIYFKAKGKEPDKEQRAYVDRINQVVYRNNHRDDDNMFRWTYRKRFDAKGHGDEVRPFKEDFFERVVNVHWKKRDTIEAGVTWRFTNTTVTTQIPSSIFQCDPPESPYLNHGPHFLASHTDYSYELSANQPEYNPHQLPETPTLIVSGAPTTPTYHLADGTGWIGVEKVTRDSVEDDIEFWVGKLHPAPAKCYGYKDPLGIGGFSSVFGRPDMGYNLDDAHRITIGIASTAGITAMIDAKDGRGPRPAKRIGQEIRSGSAGITFTVGFRLEP